MILTKIINELKSLIIVIGLHTYYFLSAYGFIALLCWCFDKPILSFRKSLGFYIIGFILTKVLRFFSDIE